MLVERTSKFNAEQIRHSFLITPWQKWTQIYSLIQLPPNVHLQTMFCLRIFISSVWLWKVKWSGVTGIRSKLTSRRTTTLIRPVQQCTEWLCRCWANHPRGIQAHCPGSDEENSPMGKSIVPPRMTHGSAATVSVRKPFTLQVPGYNPNLLSQNFQGCALRI